MLNAINLINKCLRSPSKRARWVTATLVAALAELLELVVAFAVLAA